VCGFGFLADRNLPKVSETPIKPIQQRQKLARRATVLDAYDQNSCDKIKMLIRSTGFPLIAPRPIAVVGTVFELAFLGATKVVKLFVGNLPYKAVESDIRAFFEEVDVQVNSISILRDRFSGEARGFGFVEIDDDAAARQAVAACNGRELMGRTLVVNEARPPEKREWASSGHPGRGQRDFGGSKNRW
jgi:hypothetical protein